MTRRYIRKRPALVDAIYNQDALNFYLRGTLREDFDGGSTINEDFIYDSMPGGGYQKGKTFNTPQKQTEQQLRFDLKYTQISVTLYQEDIRVLNKGPLAVIPLVKARINQAYMSLGAYVSIACYLGGQGSYIANVNGLAEALTDGTTAWDNLASSYTTYGGLTRATYSPSLTCKPLSTSGAIEYDTIDKQYMKAFYGSGTYEPNLMVTTPVGFSFIKSKFQTQQRFQDVTMTAPIGFRGLSFNGATVVASRYCPGTYLTSAADGTANGTGLQDKPAVNYLTETSSGALSAYPVGSLGNSGESLFILNARKPFLNYYVSTDEIFGGGFRDFIPQGNNTLLVGQVLLAHNMTLQPRYHQLIFGFTA